MRTEKDRDEDIPTGFIVECNFFYLLASCFLLCCNSLVRLGEQCDVAGHKDEMEMLSHQSYWGRCYLY